MSIICRNNVGVAAHHKWNCNPQKWIQIERKRDWFRINQRRRLISLPFFFSLLQNVTVYYRIKVTSKIRFVNPLSFRPWFRDGISSSTKLLLHFFGLFLKHWCSERHERKKFGFFPILTEILLFNQTKIRRILSCVLLFMISISSKWHFMAFVLHFINFNRYLWYFNDDCCLDSFHSPTKMAHKNN